MSNRSVDLINPNMFGEFYIGLPMTQAPTSLGDFLWNITEQSYGTSVIAETNDITTVSRDFYGKADTTDFITGNKKSFVITMLVIPDVDPGSLFMKLRKISQEPIGKTPTGEYNNRISFLTRGIDDTTGLPIPGDYFCPEASLSISNGVDFGTAGEAREVEITVNGILPGVIVDPNLPDAPNVPVLSIEVLPSTIAIDTGTTTNLSVTINPPNATNVNVTWSSSDLAVATVTQTGVVSGLTVGTATITATSVDGFHTDTCVVTVEAP